MKPYHERCMDLDRKKQRAAGWGAGAWVGVNFAEPKTDAERKALEIVQEEFPQTVTVHVYVLVEMLAELLSRGFHVEHNG